MSKEEIILSLATIVISVLLAYFTSKGTNKQHQEKIDNDNKNSKKEIDALKSVALIQIDSELTEINGKKAELRRGHQLYIEKLEQIERDRRDSLLQSHFNPNFEQMRKDEEDKDHKIKISKYNLNNQLALLAEREAKLIEAKEKLQKK